MSRSPKNDGERSALPTTRTCHSDVNIAEGNQPYVGKPPTESEDRPLKDIYNTDRQRDENAVTYQLKSICRREASVIIYQRGQDVDDSITNDEDVEISDVSTDTEAEDIVQNDIRQETTIKRLKDVGNSDQTITDHGDAHLPDSEFIRPYAVGYHQDGRSQTENVVGDVFNIQPYAVAYDEQNERFENQPPTGVSENMSGTNKPTSARLPYNESIRPYAVAYQRDDRYPNAGEENNEVEVEIEFGGSGSEVGKFRNPSGVVVSPSNEIFVADMLNRRVQVFSTKGVYLRHFPTVISEEAEAGTMAPNGISIDDSGHLWVVGKAKGADRLAGHIVRYTKMGRHLSTLYPSLPNNTFTDIAVDARHRRVIVTENWAHHAEVKVLLFNGSVRVLLTFGKQAWPARLAAGVDGTFLVSDVVNTSVSAYNRTGHHLFDVVGPDRNAGRLAVVAGICTDSRGNVLVADLFEGTVDLFSEYGRYVRRVVSGLNSADDVAVGPCGQLVVTGPREDIVHIFSLISAWSP
ncbi:E3 ubiquitin-protein ligase TRIM32-like [Branchiostoma lanceolatum]|uniref:E3 ubiquitin-protein ligase TRIM32-like n=1 Tax=Branchiostoma lanceolatum TaxID=7740 RepID=UPI003453F96D